MSDIIVTTPKSEMANAALEAADARINPGSHYFRVLHSTPEIESMERVFYVEDGYVRGYAVVDFIMRGESQTRCQSTHRVWSGKVTIYMRADSWKWIKPIPMRGFPGWQYAQPIDAKVVGDWLAPRPSV